MEPLHVITFYANPMGWESRRRLYEQFENRMAKNPGIRLWTREISYFGAAPETTGGKMRLSTPVLGTFSNDLMWHKENALNTLMQTITGLEPDWRYLAWIDADLTFSRSDWPEATIQALQRHSVVQPFSIAQHLDPNDQPLPDHRYRGLVANARHSRRHSPSRGWQESWTLSGHPGFAWAMTRQAYDHIGGFGDWGITGSGDRHMACCFYNQLHRSRADMTPAVQAKWSQWQDKAKELGPPGWVEGEILHHWHGAISDRNYTSRHLILRNGNPSYDPDLDIEPDPQTGLWRFTPRGERFREPLRQYFEGRKEDSNGPSL
jgi:hypothetical protein